MSGRLRGLARVVALASLTFAVAGGTAAGAGLPCAVPAGVRYTTVFQDNLATRVDDLMDRLVESFARDARGQLVYPEVRSKYDQPRTVANVVSFTTPHRGTDFSMSFTDEDSDVSAAADGTLVASTVAWKVGERIDGTHFAVYQHVKALSGFVAGRVVVAGERIARVGTPDENGGFNEHLHFGMTVDSALSVWRPISPFFAGVPGWRGGRDLEFLSFPQVDAGNRLTVDAYTLNDGSWGEHLQGCTGVSVFYRKKGTSTWHRGAMAVAERVSSGTGDIPIGWSFDLGVAGAAGDRIEWYLAAYRDPNAPKDDDYDITIDAHNYGLFPAGYAHPVDMAADYPAGKSPLFCTTVLK